MRAVLTKHYGEKCLFSSFQVDVEPGSIVRIDGPSGCGKTTMLRMLCGLETNEGEERNDFLQSTFAWVFQEDRLCQSMTAWSNMRLALPPSVGKETILSSFRLLSLDDPYRRIDQYSGGMKRRLAIMRACLSDGDIMILDEAFTGLDAVSRRLAVDFILKCRRERTILFVDHSLEDSLPQDRTIVLS